MANVLIKIGKVEEVENRYSIDNADGLRIRVRILEIDGSASQRQRNDLPWAFPLLPKVLRTAPKEGEAVLVISDSLNDFKGGMRYYIGPIISQPGYNTKCPYGVAPSLLSTSKNNNPMPTILYDGNVIGSFPNNDDVAIVGRGSEDVILRYNDASKTSEVDIRAGIRGDQTNESLMNGSTPIIGHNIIFNGADPAYIQLKYKKGIATGSKTYANSLVNIVANRINIMSNLDEDVNDKLKNNKTLVDEGDMNGVMNSLHQVPLGDKLVDLLELMWKAILNHVHDWPGNPQKGDYAGAIKELQARYPDFKAILSDYVRIS